MSNIMEEVDRKRKRSLIFSINEKHVLIREMEKVKDRLDGNREKVTNEEKVVIWKELASQVSSVAFCKGSSVEVRNKCENMTRESKKAHLVYNKAMRATGGGSPVTPLNKEQESIVNLYKSSAANYVGIDGGQETEIEGFVRLPMHVAIPMTKKVVAIPTPNNATFSVADEQEATLPEQDDASSQEAPTKRFKHSTVYLVQEATQQPKLQKSSRENNLTVRDAQQVAPNSSMKKTKLSKEAVWVAQMDLIQEQKQNLLMDRKLMTVQMEVLNLVKKSLEKRGKK